jgi:predicted nucleic acid-binding protein
MSTLLDTNVLTRSAQPLHPMFKPAVEAVAALRARGEELCLVPQVIYEFWVVCTRPLGENGLGMSPTQAQAEIDRLKQLFKLLEDTPAIFPEWERLVVKHHVAGKNAHDARLVAAMRVHGLGQILSFNVADFARYEGIVVLSPEGVADGKASMGGP